jgi:histidinol-phosphatase (PHP family)
LEVDWYHPSLAPNHAQRLNDVLQHYPFDYIIGSVHQIQVPWGGAFMIDGSATAWQKLSREQIDEVHRHYWFHMKTLAESGVYDIVAHIDLPKKFGFYPAIDLQREIADALDAIAAATTVEGGPLAVEVNTAGWHKPCVDAYPTLDILRECNSRGIPSLMNADAHHADHLVRDFEKAADRLAEAGYSQGARFSQRAIRFEPLTEALKPTLV